MPLQRVTYGVKPENILAGNGSDEILSIIMRSFVGPQDRVAFPCRLILSTTPWSRSSRESGSLWIIRRILLVPEALASQNAALTFLCNPNSPSGTLVPLQDIERLARAVSGILVIDEAYVDFAESEGASTLPLIGRLPNLIVLRTFSKSFSLAGMRIGLAFASEEIISGMMKVKDSYNLNRLSLVAATAALQDMPWMTRNVRRIQQSRRQLSAGLRKMGFYVYPSHANFVMARKKEQNLKGLYERLKSQKILVRYFDVAGLQDSLRITVGTPLEIRALLKAMKAIGNNPTT